MDHIPAIRLLIAELKCVQHAQRGADPERVARVGRLVWSPIEAVHLAEQQPALQALDGACIERALQLAAQLQGGQGAECGAAVRLHLVVLADAAVVSL